jgi:hypothetical protein
VAFQDSLFERCGWLEPEMWLEPAEMKRPAMPAGDAVMAGLPANSVSKGKGRVPVGTLGVYI